MKKLNIKKIAKTIEAGMKTHAPEILTGIGTAGMITTVVLAVRATPKAIDILEEEERLKGEELTAVEKVQTAWKPYILPVAVGTASTACIIFGQSVNLRRNAALATAYKLSEQAYRDYKDTVLEEIGEKKEKVIREKAATKDMKRHEVEEDEIEHTKDGEYLCYDSISEKYFYSDQQTIRAHINDLNERLMTEMEISVNEYLMEIGLRPMQTGNELIWVPGHKLDVTYGTDMSNEKFPRPCLVIKHFNTPMGKRWVSGDLGYYH